MRIRNICEYVLNTPENINISILKQMITEYGETLSNTLGQLVVDADISSDTDLLGKHVDDLQTDVHFDDGKFYGKLYYVTDYTGFSGLKEEQEGYYFCFHVECDGSYGIKVNGQTLDEDGLYIILFKRVGGEHTIPIEVSAADGTFTDVIDLSGLEFIGKKPVSESRPSMPVNHL